MVKKIHNFYLIYNCVEFSIYNLNNLMLITEYCYIYIDSSTSTTILSLTTSTITLTTSTSTSSTCHPNAELDITP
jgi:hypothetical protein